MYTIFMDIFHMSLLSKYIVDMHVHLEFSLEFAKYADN